MDFDAVVNQSWAEHGEQAELVAGRLGELRELITSTDQIPRFAQLAAHVFGEHLGDWERGITLIESLREGPCFRRETEAERAIIRATATLRFASSGDRESLAGLSHSDLTRVLAMSAAALAGRRELARASEQFSEALELLVGIPNDDPAHRALAVTGNNLAADLEEKRGRTPMETDLMLLAARTARKEWEVAGTWLNVERAEYRLARTCLEAGLAAEAFEHAHHCIEICRANAANATELFWSHQALALAAYACSDAVAFSEALAAARQHFESIPESSRDWCRQGLAKISELPAL